MSKEKEITCIVCPLGCKIVVRIEGIEIKNIDGHKCKQGIEYATKEALDPRRMLTTSVFVNNGEWPLVSVKSSQPVPKDKVFQVLKKIKKLNINAPVKSGQTIITDVANTGINMIATKTITKKRK